MFSNAQHCGYVVNRGTPRCEVCETRNWSVENSCNLIAHTQKKLDRRFDNIPKSWYDIINILSYYFWGELTKELIHKTCSEKH
jgi:hypothetical protein